MVLMVVTSYTDMSNHIQTHGGACWPTSLCHCTYAQVFLNPSEGLANLLMRDPNIYQHIHWTSSSHVQNPCDLSHTRCPGLMYIIYNHTAWKQRVHTPYMPTSKQLQAGMFFYSTMGYTTPVYTSSGYALMYRWSRRAQSYHTNKAIYSNRRNFYLRWKVSTLAQTLSYYFPDICMKV